MHMARWRSLSPRTIQCPQYLQSARKCCCFRWLTRRSYSDRCPGHKHACTQAKWSIRTTTITASIMHAKHEPARSDGRRGPPLAPECTCDISDSCRSPVVTHIQQAISFHRVTIEQRSTGKQSTTSARHVAKKLARGSNPRHTSTNRGGHPL